MAVTLYITIEENSWSAATNKSNVTCAAVAKWTGGSYNLTQKPGTLTIDGTPYEFTSSFNDKRTNSGTKVLFRKTLDIPHDDKGSKKLTVSATYETGVSSGTISASAVKDLKDIPLASTVAATDANIKAVSMIAVTRRSAAYSHSIMWSFGSLSGYLNPDGTVSETEVIFSETSIPFTLPGEFYAEIPNAKTGVCTLTAKTYSGSSQVGTAQTATFTATAAESDVRPGVSGQIKDVNNSTIALTGDDDILVRFFSNAKCSIKSTILRGGATFVEKKIGGEVVTTSPAARTIYGIDTDTVEFKVTDSRGYVGTDMETVQMIPYIRLTNNAVASRVAPATGISKLTLSGNYFNDTFGLRANELTVQYTVDGGDPVTVSPTLDGNTYKATVEIPNLDYRTGHTMTVTVSDKLDTVVKEIEIARSIPTYHHGADFFAFYVPVEFRGGIAPGYDASFIGTAAELSNHLKKLAATGTMTARLGGTYTVNTKIPVPAGMTIIGGTFITDPTFEDAIFSALGDNVRLVGVTMAAPALDKVPKIYTENSVETEALDSNVMGVFSNGWENIELVNCVCDKIIPAKINNGSAIIRGCRVTDASMFIWATNSRISAIANDVSICDTGLDKYYHVYYLDQDSELYTDRNRIRCDTTAPYWDVFHLMTAGNNGTYRASGLCCGDVITGNFQYIIDSHYTDLVLDGCHIANSNPDSWTEFSNMAHSSFRYSGCTLDYANAAEQTYDNSISGYVVYHNCQLTKNARLNRRATYNDCRIIQDIASGGLFGNLVNVYNCEMQVYGSPQCIGVYSTGSLTADFVGNVVKFDSTPSSPYLFNFASFTGVICNNVVTNANGTKVWNVDRGGAFNNIINGMEV